VPDVSKAQRKLMLATEHGWKKPGGGGPSPEVAAKFTAADKAKGKRYVNALPQRKTKPPRFA
jgi:hypothetical protein